jgi:hypothetical protein
MKKNIIKITGLFAFALMFFACDSTQDVTPIAEVGKPAMTIAFPTAVTVNEGDLIPFTLTLSAPVGKDFDVYVVMNQQTSTAGSLDSNVESATVNTTYQKKFTFPAFSTTYSDVIEIYNDDLKEGDENLGITFGDTRTTAVSLTPVVSNITIKNVVKDELTLDFHFDKTFYGENGYSNSLCKLASSITAAPNNKYDVDFIVYDNTFTDVGNVQAQTSACTESLTMKLSDYPDGLYHITAFLYTNADLDFAMLSFPLVGSPQFDIPITVDYLRSGSIDKGTYTQEAVNYFNSNTAAGTENQVVDVLISTVGGVRKFTIQDTAGNISASGKSALTHHIHTRRNK